MENSLNVIPEPVQWSLTGGQFAFTPAVVVAVSGDAAPAAAGLVSSLSSLLGVELAVRSTVPAGQKGVLRFELDAQLAGLGPEGYRLSVQPDQVTLRAFRPAGLFYAAQTLRQLLPVQAFGTTAAGVELWLPCVEIEDYPRFAWRGAMLDVCRHFMPKEFIFKLLDLMALHKLNTFHWHLTDDQGWRLEIKKYPRLTSVGAWRKETLVGHFNASAGHPVFDGVRHGGFFSQQDVREVVDYARQRFIQVVPEIEMPGHAQAAVAAYPELGNTGKPVEVNCSFGINEDVFNAEESTLRFLQDVLDEVMDLFPGSFIHVGGDECPKTQWKNSPAAQARIRELGLNNEDELQSYIIRQMDRYLAARGRRLIGWDEILEGGLAPGAAVMSWRGDEGGIAAANAGHDVVMAHSEYTYLDHYQTGCPEQEPLAIGGYLPLEKVYTYNPLPGQIDADKAAHVMGVQCQLWTEYIPDPLHAEPMLFPRLCALADTAWRPVGRTDFLAFSQRMETHLQRLDKLGVKYFKSKD